MGLLPNTGAAPFLRPGLGRWPARTTTCAHNSGRLPLTADRGRQLVGHGGSGPPASGRLVLTVSPRLQQAGQGDSGLTVNGRLVFTRRPALQQAGHRGPSPASTADRCNGRSACSRPDTVIVGAKRPGDQAQSQAGTPNAPAGQDRPRGEQGRHARDARLPGGGAWTAARLRCVGQNAWAVAWRG